MRIKQRKISKNIQELISEDDEQSKGWCITNMQVSKGGENN